MGFLSKLFGGGTGQYDQMRDDYRIAMSPYTAWYQQAVQAAQPVDQSYSQQFQTAYTNLGREQAARGAQQRYQSGMSAALMRSAAGRQQAAGVASETAGALAREESANMLGLEQAKIGLNQQNWSNRMAYAGLRGQQAGFGAQQAGAEGQYQMAGQQAKAQRRSDLMGLAGSIGGMVLGPALSGFGGSLASGLGVGMPKPKSAYAPGGKDANMYAAGGSTRQSAVVGDGGAAPELILNPTGAPLTVVPLTGRTTSRWVDARSFVPQQQPQQRSAYDYLPRYACGGKTSRPMFIAGEGRR